MHAAVLLVSLVNPLDPKSVAATFGALGVGLVLFAETGLLIGFFLPGDSLLFTAGLLCSTRSHSTVHLNLAVTLTAAALGAVLGAQCGFLIGRRVGAPLLIRRNRPRLSDAAHRADSFFTRYGYPKAIVLARFVPLVRTVINPLAGILSVPARTFLVWQVIGGLLWSLGITVAGYELGSRIHNVDRYVLPIIALIVVVSLLPVLIGVIRARRAANAS